MSLTASDFDYLRELVRREAAIVLEPGKEYLALTRLDPIAKGEGLASVSDLVARLRSEAGRLCTRRSWTPSRRTRPRSSGISIPSRACAPTSSPSSSNGTRSGGRSRSGAPRARAGRSPTAWRCSSGSISRSWRGWRIDLLGTDISPSMLERARAGRYGQLEVNRGLPAQLLLKYFRRVGAHWELDASIRGMVRFERHNLVGAWPPFPPFDIVFLRNVLIYFGLETKRQVLARVRSVMRPEGYLLLGGSETTLNIDDGFERVPIGRTTWYRPRPQPGRGGDGCS